jgi:hypothetical protein
MHERHRANGAIRSNPVGIGGKKNQCPERIAHLLASQLLVWFRGDFLPPKGCGRSPLTAAWFRRSREDFINPNTAAIQRRKEKGRCTCTLSTRSMKTRSPHSCGSTMTTTHVLLGATSRFGNAGRAPATIGIATFAAK